MAMISPAAPPVDMTQVGRMHLNRMANEDEDPSLLKGINYPGKHDVMLGRGGESTYHCGNIAFRQLVEDHKNQYYTAPRAHKSRVVAEVVRKWRQLTPPGRFLTRSNPTDGDKSAWHDVGDRRALKKASHSLRDAVRCFSIEKKQREKEMREMAGAEMMTTTTDTRKRGRVVDDEPEYMPSMAAKARVMSSVGRSHFGASSRGSEFMVSTQPKKASIVIMPAEQQRPTKMRRVVCDEREEAEDDCRREGGDDDCGRGGGEDERRCSGEERESCDREDDCGGRSDVRGVPSSIFVERPTSFFAPPEATPMFANAPVCPKQQERLESNASPCGSAGWFTTGIADLPVRAAPSFALPTADVLVQEVVSAPSNAANQHLALGSLSDEDSMGWFSEGEEDPTSFFTSSAPSFHVSLHKPVASRKNRASSGREL